MRGILMVVGVALMASACSDPIGPVPPGELAPGMPAVAVPAYTVGEQTDEGLRCRFRPVFNRELHWIRGSVVVPSLGMQAWYDPQEMRANTHLGWSLVHTGRTSFYVVWQFTYYIHDREEYVDINGVFTCVAPPKAAGLRRRSKSGGWQSTRRDWRRSGPRVSRNHSVRNNGA